MWRDCGSKRKTEHETECVSIDVSIDGADIVDQATKTAKEIHTQWQHTSAIHRTSFRQRTIYEDTPQTGAPSVFFFGGG